MKKLLQVIGIIIIGFVILFLGVPFLLGMLASITTSTIVPSAQYVDAVDHGVMAALAIVRSEAEIYHDSNKNSYAGVCKDASTVSYLKQASKVVTSDKDENKYACNDSSQNYAASVPLLSGGYWCIDDSGLQTKTATTLGSSSSCPH